MVFNSTRYWWFLLTILCATFCTSFAGVEETGSKANSKTIPSNEADQITLRRLVERYITEQVQRITTNPSNNQLESDINKDIKETADKTMLQLAIDTKQIINKRNLAFIQTKIAGLIDKDFQNENKTIEDNNSTLFNKTQQVPSVGGLCVVNVPSSIKTRSDIWEDRSTPKMDDLDKFMNETRGCQYKAVRFYFENFFFPVHYFDGTPFETHFAIRTSNKAHIKVTIANIGVDYSLDIGDNNITKLTDQSKRPFSTLASQPTPGILKDDSYVEFYIKIDSNSLSFGKKCEKPIITHNFTIKKGDKVHLAFESYSVYGGKLLHGCPATSG